MVKRIFLSLTFFIGSLLLLSPAGAQLEALAHPLFPLEKGNYWIYEGTTRWTDSKNHQVLTKQVTWKMMVTDVVGHDSVSAAVVKGHPQDLAWFAGDTQPGNYLIIKILSKYYLVGEERFDEVLARLKDLDDDLQGLVQDEEIFLEESPSGIARSFGAPEQMARSDWSYFWYVDGVNKVDLKDLKGLNLPEEQLQYRLMYKTLPDDVQVDIVPGVGITRYIYNHHGVVAQTDVRLVEYSAG